MLDMNYLDILNGQEWLHRMGVLCGRVELHVHLCENLFWKTLLKHRFLGI